MPREIVIHSHLENNIFITVHNCDVEDRDLAREILIEEFGEGNVVAVSNFNTFKLKSLVKDLSRLYEIPFEEVNAVTKVMESEARQALLDEVGGDQKFYEFSFDGAIKHSPTFRDFIQKYPKLEEGIKVLYKQIITLGRHAGGVVICDDAGSSMPVIKAKGDIDQTPWSEGLTAKHLEQWGLIKYDFLGLGTLRIIRRCIELILKEKMGFKNPTSKDVITFYKNHLRPDVIGDGDPEVFNAVYKKGKFPGIFQFAENGAQNFCHRAQPEKVSDISAITAIFRPGPLHGHADKKYIEARHGNVNVELSHPVLEKILGPTYGLLIYQESFMQLAHELAGYSLEDSDKLRKLLVKPVTTMAEEMKKKREEEREKFISGCVESGLSLQRSIKLWDEEILGFISYGFNKSHSMAYAYVSYQCAWLLHYYENQWLRAYLEIDSDRDKAVNDVVACGYKMGKPDILISADSWKIENGTIYPSLSSIKGIGAAAVEELLTLREQNNFVDFYDFLWFDEEKQYKNGKTKVTKKWRWSKFNKRAFDALIKCEAFDSFEMVGPEKLFESYRQFYDFFMGNYDKIKKGKIEMFDSISEYKSDEWTKEQKILFQQELMGSYDKSLLFDDGTLDFFRDNDILPLSDLGNTARWHWFVVKDVSKATTAGGKPFLKLKISDLDDKAMNFNYFGPTSLSEIRKGSVHLCTLYVNGQWINCPKNQKILKAS